MEKLKRPDIKKEKRLRIFNQLGGRCAYCGSEISINKFQIDHYYPVSSADYCEKKFGVNAHDESNLKPTCRKCNHYKRADLPEDFRTKIATIHKRIMSEYIVEVGVNFGIVTIKPFDGRFYFEHLNTLKDKL